MEGKKMEKDFVLQWGNRKRLRCFNKLKREKERRFGNKNSSKSTTTTTTTTESSPFQKKLLDSPVQNHLNMNSDLATNNKPRSALTSAEKEDRYYATRGSGSLELDDNTKVSMENHQIKEDKAIVWPRLFTTLSSKEKEQDFMAMKGCKLPQRPKKRAKLIQRSILLVSPGAWLSDLCQERYQVREKKTSKKKPRGLRAMGSAESDSERD